MSAKEIRAGKAYVELSIRDKLTQGLRSAWGRLKAFAGMVKTAFFAVTGAIAGITAAISAAVTPIVMMAKHFSDVGSELNDMAARTGVAVETLSQMKYAAEQTGASLSDVEMALRTMARKGIPVEKFDELAKAIAAIEDPSERAAAAMQIFGKSGTKLLPMLREWDDLRERAQRLGLVVTTEEAEKADELGDRFDDLGRTWDRLKVKAGASFAEPMILSLNALINLIGTIGKALEVLANSMAAVSAGMWSMAKAADSLIRKLGSSFLNAASGVMGAGIARITSQGGSASKLAPGMDYQVKRAIAAAGSSFGTFSSPGAGLAGRAGQGIKRDDGLDKKMVALLEKIGVKLDTLEEINDGIEELEVGFQ